MNNSIPEWVRAECCINFQLVVPLESQRRPRDHSMFKCFWYFRTPNKMKAMRIDFTTSLLYDVERPGSCSYPWGDSFPCFLYRFEKLSNNRNLLGYLFLLFRCFTWFHYGFYPWRSSSYFNVWDVAACDHGFVSLKWEASGRSCDVYWVATRIDISV